MVFPSDFLMAAVKFNDIDRIRELISYGANPHDPLLLDAAVFHSSIEIIKLLLRYSREESLDSLLNSYIFKHKNTQYCKELMVLILERFKSNIKLIHKIFYKLVRSECKGPLALEILKLLLDYGLIIESYYQYGCYDYTILQLLIIARRIDLIPLIIERGGNVNERNRLSGSTPLILAVQAREKSVVEMLLKNGADINVKAPYGVAMMSAFQLVSRNFLKYQQSKHHFDDFSEYVWISTPLLKYGADIDVLDHLSGFHITNSVHEIQDLKKVVIRTLVELKFEGLKISEKNLEYIQGHDDLQKTFDDCSEELNKMKSIKFYGGLSIYDVFKVTRQPKKLISLTKNEDLVEAFRSSWNSEIFKFYSYFKHAFEDALKKRDILLSDEKKLHSIFKDVLPELVINRIALLENEHLFED